VLVVNRVGFLGGVERVILTAATGVAALGWRTVLACPSGPLADQARLCRIPVQAVEICSLGRTQLGRSPRAWGRAAMYNGSGKPSHFARRVGR
jgi:hypothetical protein